jgi:phospholipase C
MRRHCHSRHLPPLILLGACAAAAAGCSGAAATAVPPAQRQQVQAPVDQFPPPAASKIQHVVIILQENESFDHLFKGYPKARTASTGLIHTGKRVPLVQQELGAAVAASHYASDFLADYDGGKLDGFDLNTSLPKPNLLPYTFVNPSEIKPYYQMAQQYVLNDNYFTSHIDASFVSHQYIIAAQADSAVDLPSGSWGCAYPSAPDYVTTLNQDRAIGGFESPCFDYKTLGDELDTAGLTWRFYATYIDGSHCPPSQPSCDSSGGGFSSYQAVNHIFNGPDWSKDVISPNTQILTDVPNGTLANVTWVTPNYCNSDHPGSLGSKGCPQPEGPAWVASIVNAIGESKFWDSTVIFVTWDEWGAEYDHVVPPYKDYDGDGFRVPLLCISPYAYENKVNHVQLESAGIPRFVEQTFHLQTLSAADQRAAPAGTGCINHKASSPRPFTPISSSVDANYFLHVQPPSRGRPDDE